MLGKAQGLPADQVFLDLEDSVAPLAKVDARANIVAALNEGDWAGKTRVVRVNDWTTQWTYGDVIAVVEGAGANLDAVMLPKVQTRRPGARAGPAADPDREDASASRSAASASRRRSRTPRGLVEVDAIAAASPRVETIIFGPADFMASINMKSLVVGEQPPGYDVGDAYHYILMRILMAARDATTCRRSTGRTCRSRTSTGFRRVAGRSAALGFDGKWVLHPGQIDAANEVYSPAPGRLRPRRADPRRLRVATRPRPAGCAAR